MSQQFGVNRQTLYDPRAPFDEIAPEPPPPALDPGVVVRRVGDFVGRRSEQRWMKRMLRHPDTGGVLVHGIGGVGKSSLTASVLHELVAAGDGWLVASVAGETHPDAVLGAIGKRLWSAAMGAGVDEDHPLRRIGVALQQQKIPWEQRLGLLTQEVFPRRRLVFLLDNFEDNLDGSWEAGRARELVNEDLGKLLAAWLAQPGQSRVLVTSRHPFSLPADGHEALGRLHLGPLSVAEARKLVWRLPALDALPPDELQRAYEQVGGHPRALEYLDALLRDGKARFPDVERRLRKGLGVDEESAKNVLQMMEEAAKRKEQEEGPRGDGPG